MDWKGYNINGQMIQDFVGIQRDFVFGGQKGPTKTILEVEGNQDTVSEANREFPS